MIASRLAAAISLALLWRLTTRWNELLGSLRFIGVPSTFLFTTTLAYRYLFVLVETLGEMVQARTARQVGACDRAQVGAYTGSGSAILFAKSIAFTEELHMAMQARGGGRFSNTRSVLTWRFRDVATVALAAGAFLLVVLPGVLHAI
jgi:energy-coupling factor transporter transmembrane protein EcfT